MIGTANGVAISITGLGGHVPERVVTNDELSTMMDTSDEWILERTRGPIGKGRAEARVGGVLAARAILTFAVEQS